MKSRTIEVNGKSIKCYADGSIEQFNGNTNKLSRRLGRPNVRGYMVVPVSGQIRYVHRLMCAAFIGDIDGMDCDHINGDKSDNRLENLRVVTHAQNNRGWAKRRKGSSSRYRGVSVRVDGKFRARIHKDGVGSEIGVYDDEILAALAYDAMAIKMGYSPEALNRPH